MQAVKKTRHYSLTLECSCGFNKFTKLEGGYQCQRCGIEIPAPYWENGMEFITTTDSFENFYKTAMNKWESADTEVKQCEAELAGAIAKNEPGILERAKVNRAKRLRDEASKRAELAVAIQNVMVLEDQGKIEMHLPKSEGFIAFTWGGYSEDDLFDGFFGKKT